MALHIDVTLYECGIDGCDTKCKQKANLKQHKAARHNIGVT